jgi:hypothetical protein
LTQQFDRDLDPGLAARDPTRGSVGRADLDADVAGSTERRVERSVELLPRLMPPAQASRILDPIASDALLDPRQMVAATCGQQGR